MKFFLGILAGLLLVACAPALYSAKFPADENVFANAKIQFSARENGSAVQIPDKLQTFYAKELSAAIPDGCTLRLNFDGTVEERYASAWYFGILLLAPLWPAMPREDDLTVKLEASLVCEETLAEKIFLVEEEHPRLFWYGPYRNGFVQDHANWIHTKLLSRLKQALQQNVPADATARSDFF